ncbi:hypothetical protein AGMMS49959_17630 [Planctomycetales bacterium]|nr:hypothetical protein AGMMS49959_17630 [Planctomycetales bacterium]
MNFQFSKQAVKTLARLDAPTKQRLEQGITGIPQGDIKPLSGVAGTYRLRVGDWRILFSYPAAGTALVEKIAPRGDVYKGI